MSSVISKLSKTNEVSKIQSLQKETQTFKQVFLQVKTIDFQNDFISVALSFNKDLYKRVSSKI